MTRRTLLISMSVMPILAAAQGGQERKSPHETVDLDLGGQKISISYGRPSLKGRKAYTGDLAPSGQVWRLGADEATKLVLTAAAVANGTVQMAAGSYSLFAIPGASEWTMIINKTADQWGAFNYSQAQDLGRFTVAVKPTAVVEEFTIKLTKASANSATVSLAWQEANVSFPIKFV